MHLLRRFAYKSLIDLGLLRWVNRASGKKMRNRSQWEGDSLSLPAVRRRKDKELWIRGQEIKLLLFAEDFAIIMKQKAKYLLNMVSVFFVRLSLWRGWHSILQNAVASSPAVKNSCSINEWNWAA